MRQGRHIVLAQAVQIKGEIASCFWYDKINNFRKISPNVLDIRA